MDLLQTPEQDEIVDSAAAFLRGRMPVAHTRELIAAGNLFDASAFGAAAELGWLGLGLPESLGGVGGALADEAVLFREIGRSLATGPFLSTVLAARVAAVGGNAALAEEIVGGRPVGLAIASAVSLFDGEVVSGDLQLLDTTGDLVLVVEAHRAAIVPVDRLADVQAVPCYDDASSLKRATAHAVQPIVAVDAATEPAQRRGHVLAAAMLTGITEASRDIGSEHAKVRVQFDRPIGVNQAIKHPCADMAVRAQLALAQTLFGAIAHDESRPDADFHALSAHLVAAEAAEFSSAAALQIMGGMGFTST
jgi:alkylation response protein AidB-like acyl-CoA dehydrogenase